MRWRRALPDCSPITSVRANWAERARVVAETRYSLDRCIDEYELLYHRVLEMVVC